MKKYIILVILLIVLGCGIFITCNVLDNEAPSIKKIFNKTEYKIYKAGNVVEFADERWYVLHNSDNKTEYVTLISSNIMYLDDEELAYVIGGIYETSAINNYLSNEYVKKIGSKNFVEVNGYKARLFNKDDFDKLIDATYDEDTDSYNINNCPEYICLTNTSFATMIDTNQNKEFVDVYNNINDIENLLYGDYTLHLKYYNITSTYEKHMLLSLVDDATLFVRPVINVYKSSLE